LTGEGGHICQRFVRGDQLTTTGPHRDRLKPALTEGIEDRLTELAVKKLAGDVTIARQNVRNIKYRDQRVETGHPRRRCVGQFDGAQLHPLDHLAGTAKLR
jgi:hypothetical protein